jgi:hypothetical protein
MVTNYLEIKISCNPCKCLGGGLSKFFSFGFWGQGEGWIFVFGLFWSVPNVFPKLFLIAPHFFNPILFGFGLGLLKELLHKYKKKIGKLNLKNLFLIEREHQNMSLSYLTYSPRILVKMKSSKTWKAFRGRTSKSLDEKSLFRI